MSHVEKLQIGSTPEVKVRDAVRWKNLASWIGVLAFALIALVVYPFISTGSTSKEVSAPGLNAEGLAIYHQSERGPVALPRANASGLATYHESERNLGVLTGANKAGMAIYQQSERGFNQPVIFGLTEEGLAIYQASERNTLPAWSVNATQDGMAVYYASERGLGMAPARLFDGLPFNAYQRSEWLGQER